MLIGRAVDSSATGKLRVKTWAKAWAFDAAAASECLGVDAPLLARRLPPEAPACPELEIPLSPLLEPGESWGGGLDTRLVRAIRWDEALIEDPLGEAPLCVGATLWSDSLPTPGQGAALALRRAGSALTLLGAGGAWEIPMEERGWWAPPSREATRPALLAALAAARARREALALGLAVAAPMPGSTRRAL